MRFDPDPIYLDLVIRVGRKRYTVDNLFQFVR